ncbi:MAG: hypothetical protein ACRERE_19960 [Candidatus Entotheonellia bacterium]
MTPLEWFFVITAATSVPAAMLTAVAWWNGRYTNQLIKDGAEYTQRLIRESASQTQSLIDAGDKRTQDILDRMDARAEMRYRDLKGEQG